MTPQFSESFLCEHALDALHITAAGVRENTCDPVSNEFAHRLETEFNLDLPDAAYAPFHGRKHFVALVPAEHCTFTGEAGYVVVDATVKQFDDVVDTPLPDVAILPPGDPRRKEWYDEVRTP